MKKFDIVAFDLDSTLVSIEGLDWLAEQKGCKEKVYTLTKQSMEGLIPLEEAMTKKVEILAPSLKDLESLGAYYCQNIVVGVEETISVLNRLNKELWIVTGNFYPAVLPIAKKLGISKKNIASNTIVLSKNKEYGSIDLENPLLRNGGKAVVVRSIVNKSQRKIAFIGDSVSDMETKGDVDLFIGFGGVVQRDIVKEKAEVYVTNPNMLSILPYILTKEEARS